MNKVVCPNCGKRTGTAEQLKQYEYSESGLDGVILHGGVTQITCACSDDACIRVEKEGQLLQVLALALLTKPAPLEGPEQRFLRGECELTQDEMAALLKINRRATIADRERKGEKLAPADDFWFRTRVVHEFHRLLRIPGKSHLETEQFEHLLEIQRTLDQLFQELAERARKRRMSVSLVKGTLWKVDKRAA
jgi:DNA-binding transcriptional regulator YiaG